jgi:predicted dehydrogenase
MAEPIRFGVLGCANIARKVIRAMTLAEGVEACAVGSRSLDKAKQFAAELKEKTGADLKAYGSYEEVLSDPRVDVVYMPLPTSLHVEWVAKAAAQKKHVLLEKPPALSMEDMAKILKACEDAGVQYMDNTMWLHNPRAEAIKEVARSKENFGDVLRFEAALHFHLPLESGDIRLDPTLDALGALGDIGWYCVSHSLWAMDWDLPARVRAQPGTKKTDGGVITSVGATLVWADGRVATFYCSFEAAWGQQAYLIGSKAHIRWGDLVIPMREDSSAFTFSSKPGLVNNDTQVSNDYEETRLALRVPQEALVLEDFAEIVAKLKGGDGSLDKRWPERSYKTLRVLLAVKESVDSGDEEVRFS